MIYYLSAAICYFLVMCLTFVEHWRNHRFYIGACLLFNFFSASMWFSFVKTLPSKENILLHSVYWDLMIMIIGYILPVFIFHFKLNYLQITGIFVIFIGFCMLKAFND